MISKIFIQNFKSLENVTIECSNLNVLTGLNGMGKSSVIQSLLLLRQSYERGFLQNEGLTLNGELVMIGTVKDALYEFTSKEEINFSLDFTVDDDTVNKDWFFIREVNDPDSKEEEKKYSRSDFMPFSGKIPLDIDFFSLFSHNSFKYLNADRWVKNEYETSDFNVVRNRYLGKHGEYTAHYLNHFGSTPIHKDLLFDDTFINELEIQVCAWLSIISPGTKVTTETINGSDSIKLRYIFEGEKESTSEIKPMNVGFGLTYVLPVLVALLSAKKDDTLIIENPESHIHPKGQSAIGNLIAKVAQLGVQIFVETHSDHIINGILVASKNFEKNSIGIDCNLIRMMHCEKVQFATQIKEIKILAGGKISDQPEDFFDQSDKDLKYLLGF